VRSSAIHCATTVLGPEWRAFYRGLAISPLSWFAVLAYGVLGARFACGEWPTPNEWVGPPQFMRYANVDPKIVPLFPDLWIAASVVLFAIPIAFLIASLMTWRFDRRFPWRPVLFFAAAEASAWLFVLTDPFRFVHWTLD